MNKILFFNRSILSLKSVIIASAKKNIATFVRPPECDTNECCDMKKNEVRNAYVSLTYFFDIIYIIKGEIENIEGIRSL